MLSFHFYGKSKPLIPASYFAVAIFLWIAYNRVSDFVQFLMKKLGFL